MSDDVISREAAIAAAVKAIDGYVGTSNIKHAVEDALRALPAAARKRSLKKCAAIVRKAISSLRVTMAMKARP